MKISIITICYNDLVGLEKTAKSIICQTFKDYEWIVVDGGSSDGSQDIIKKYISYISSWVSEPDNGIFNAMNKGIRMAKGDYLLFLNSGDILASPKSLHRVCSVEWKSDIVACAIFWDFDKKIKTLIHQPRIVNYQRLLIESISHQSTFIKRELLQNTGYHEDYKIISDWIFWFEHIIIGSASYQSLDIPVSIYDMKGISNTNQQSNELERKRYLSQYFSSEILDKLIRQSDWKSGLQALRVHNGIRSIVISLSDKVLFLYFKFVNRIVTYYYNYRYIKY